MSTGAVNAEGLAQADGSLESDGSGKLSDVAIRSLCTEQYKVVQMGASPGDNPLYCTFDDIQKYADNAQCSKGCSLTYSPYADYPHL